MEVDQAVPQSTPKANDDTPQAPSYLQSVLQQLLALITPTPLSFPPLLSSSAVPENATPVHLPTTSALGAIHVAALECLNNAFLTLALSDEGASALGASLEDGQRVWDALWTALGSVGLEGGRGQERRKEMWEVAVGVLWGVGGVWKGNIVSHINSSSLAQFKWSKYQVPNEEQIKLLTQFCDASPDAQIKVKCIGALECLAQHPTSIEANAVREFQTSIGGQLIHYISGGCSLPFQHRVICAERCTFGRADLPGGIFSN